MSEEELPITHDWLKSVGFQENSLSWSLLIPAIDGGAIVELTLQEPNEQLDTFLGCKSAFGWTLALIQGLPDGDDQNYHDDHVTITSMYPTTRGPIIKLCDALCRPLPPQPTK